MKVKKIISLILLFTFLFNFSVFANESSFKLPDDCDCKSYVLIDENSGKVLLENNSDEKFPIASLTKIMTMLLLAEKVEREGKSSLTEETVTTSPHAKSMTGSKIFLDVDEQMSLEDMLKAIALSSGNDAAVAVAEHISGTEEDFVEAMNKKAKELGMENTHFVNACGLHHEKHYSSAKDVAIMSRELLLNHSWIKKYTSTYVDEVNISGKNGSRKHQCFNTNKLTGTVNGRKNYEGCTGLKTGHTNEAGDCLCASATRKVDDGKKSHNMSLICVCLGASSLSGAFDGKIAREKICKQLLDYGFSSFKILDARIDEKELAPVKVFKGKKSLVSVGVDEKSTSVLVKKSSASEIEKSVEINEEINAPIEKGQVVGRVIYRLSGEQIAEQNIIAQEEVKRADFIFLFVSIVNNFFTGAQI